MEEKQREEELFEGETEDVEFDKDELDQLRALSAAEGGGGGGKGGGGEDEDGEGEEEKKEDIRIDIPSTKPTVPTAPLTSPLRLPRQPPPQQQAISEEKDGKADRHERAVI